MSSPPGGHNPGLTILTAAPVATPIPTTFLPTVAVAVPAVAATTGVPTTAETKGVSDEKPYLTGRTWCFEVSYVPFLISTLHRKAVMGG
jgi:hypothetical protein